MDKAHVINLQGREYVTFEGLLNEAHKQGLRSIHTVIVQLPNQANENTAVVTAEVEFCDPNGEVKTFTGIGDASPRNVGRNIIPHILRMAETRAKARALRDGTNIGMTAFEELLEGELPAELGAPKGESTAASAPVKKSEPLATKAQIESVTREMKRTGLTPEQGREYIQEHFKKISRSELTKPEIEAFLAWLMAKPAAGVAA